MGSQAPNVPLRLGAQSARDASAGLSRLVKLSLALATQGSSVLSLLLPASGAPASAVHWPDGDASDPRSGYRWYYHCHPRDARIAGEHGHFHLFAQRAGGESVSHLLAISVNNQGLPIGLFAPNRWVTGERWLSAPSVLRKLQHLAVRAGRLQRVSDWLSALLRAFAPQIRWLLGERDRRLRELSARRGDAVFEDRRTPLFARCAISLEQQALLLDHRLA